MRDILIEDIKNSLKRHIGKSCLLAENIADDLIADGWMRPPCKVGDKMYFFYNNNVFDLVVEKIVKKESGLFLVDKQFNDWYSIEEVGKTIFLSREEAEKALKGKENE